MLLSIDTSAAGADRHNSAAVFDSSGGILRTGTCPSTAESIVELVDSFPEWKSREQFTAVAVNQGPGSFTGVRIGLSIAQGIGFGLRIPVVPLPLLESFAASLLDAPGECLVAVVANPSEYFLAGYRRGAGDSASARSGLLSNTVALTSVANVELENYDVKLLSDDTNRSVLIGQYAISFLVSDNLASDKKPHSISMQPIAPLYGKALNAKTLIERGVGQGGRK